MMMRKLRTMLLGRLTNRRGKSEIMEWVEAIIVAGVLAMFIRTFFLQAFKIPSGSMVPTLLVGDRLMVNKLRYGPKVPFTEKRIKGLRGIERGDVLVFKFPNDPKRDFIKRVVALGGDDIEILAGDIFINGKRLEDPRIKNTYYYNRGAYAKANTPTTVPEGHIFVLGDNSASSHDSRYWGFVPVENVVGKAEFIYWPLNRMRWIE